MSLLQELAQPWRKDHSCDFNAAAADDDDDDGDNDACDCIEWLAVLAAEVPCTPLEFRAQLQALGAPATAVAIAVHLQRQRRGSTVSCLARCCSSIVKASAHDVEVIISSGAAGALLSQLKLQAGMCRSSDRGVACTAIVSICTLLVTLCHGCPSRTRQLVSLGAVAGAAAALGAKGTSAAAAAAAQFATVRAADCGGGGDI